MKYFIVTKNFNQYTPLSIPNVEQKLESLVSFIKQFPSKKELINYLFNHNIISTTLVDFAFVFAKNTENKVDYYEIASDIFFPFSNRPFEYTYEHLLELFKRNKNNKQFFSILYAYIIIKYGYQKKMITKFNNYDKRLFRLHLNDCLYSSSILNNPILDLNIKNLGVEEVNEIKNIIIDYYFNNPDDLVHTFSIDYISDINTYQIFNDIHMIYRFVCSKKYDEANYQSKLKHIISTLFLNRNGQVNYRTVFDFLMYYYSQYYKPYLEDNIFTDEEDLTDEKYERDYRFVY